MREGNIQFGVLNWVPVVSETIDIYFCIFFSFQDD